MSAHQKLEHAEHASHAGHEHDHGGTSGIGVSGSGKLYGVTMALIGVLIALCSAKLGEERNELTRTMIKQTQSHASYTAASTKLRLVMIELVKQKARKTTYTNTPQDDAPLIRFLQLQGDYKKERDVAKEWADSHEPQVKTQFEAAESYEVAQVLAEIGIVLASLAVLLSSRFAWMLSIIISVASVGQLARTHIKTTRLVEQSEKRIEETAKAFEELRLAHVGDNEDDKLIKALDPTGELRAVNEARAKNREPGAPQKQVHNKEPGEK